MVNPELISYVRQQLQQEASREQITKSLTGAGWQKQPIDEVFASLGSDTPLPPLTDTALQPKHKFISKAASKILIIILCVLAGVGITGGAGWAYLGYWQNPEKITQKMVIKMMDIKSWEYAGAIRSEVNTDALTGSSNGRLGNGNANSQSGNAAVTFSGATDIQTTNNPKATLNLNMTGDVMSQENYSLGLEARVLDKTVYIRLTEAPDIGLFDLSAVKDQWIKIDINALIEEYAGSNAEEIKEVQEKYELSQAKTEKMKTLIKETEVLDITEKLASEQLEGISTYHYKFTINKAELKKFIVEASQIVGGEPLTAEQSLEVDEQLDKVELPNGELWVGKRDKLLYKFSLDLIVRGNNQSTAATSNFTVTFKNYNQPVQVEAPQSAITFQQLIEQFVGAGAGGGINAAIQSPSPQDIAKDTDGDNLPDQIEEFYGTDPANVDTDGDGYKDGEEVEKGYDPKGPGRL